uniref:Phosphatidylinositol glycan anchor biosynthesis class G n=1 Tax=Pipistrellus kuhlii TaxID=59472 RepID=A0A7J7RW59_PIPKU|nr:phosphatidylinositol glycan anchor biosynthesis class G [Pipistrellus kuhlii]
MRLGCGAFAAGCVAVEVLGVALFLRGFFPPPVRSSSQPAPPAAPEPSAGASSSGTKLLPPLFGKVVVMLIDGLRDDFVFGSKGVKFMPYTTYLVEEGASHSFVAEAKPPTVTMPRIKLVSLAFKCLVLHPGTMGKETSVGDRQPPWLRGCRQKPQLPRSAGRQCRHTGNSRREEGHLLWR